MSHPHKSNLSCWLLSEPKAGMAVQCSSLAEAMGIEGEPRQITRRFPWSILPLSMWLAGTHATGPGSNAIAPPWPNLLISCGRYAAGVAMAIRRASAGRTFNVHVQDPRISPHRFDLLIVPEHDRVRGENVLVMQGSLHKVTESRLAAEADRFAASVAHLPRPRAAVLIGGPNRAYRLGEEEAKRIASQLAQAAEREGLGLMMTVSRRTQPAALAILRQTLEQAGVPFVLWDGEGENPYFGYLGLADLILVTADSVNMTCEASATGKPVYTIELPGGSAKFNRFHQQMREQNRTRLFEGTVEAWQPTPLRENERVAAEVWRRLSEHRPELTQRGGNA